MNQNEFINFEEVEKSLRFFPKWASHDPNQVLGLINLMFHVTKENPNISSALEIGSHIGETTNMFLGIPNIKKLYCVDDYTNQDIKMNFIKRMKAYMVSGRLIVINKEINDAYHILQNKKFDLIYIDAPEYLKNKSNLDLWKNLLNPNGFLCGHDYHNFRWKEALLSVDSFFKDNKNSFKELTVFKDTSWCMQRLDQ